MKLVRLILINLSVAASLLLLVEVVLRLCGYSTYIKGKADTVIVEPHGRFYQRNSLLGYKNRAGTFRIRYGNDFEFTSQHDSTTRRITSPQEKNKKTCKKQYKNLSLHLIYRKFLNIVIQK